MHRLSYANVVATIAVFIALGGASYAAVKLPKNSVGTKQLKKSAVTGVKVKNDSLTGKDIDEASLGPVPSAAQANDAKALGGVPAAQFYSKSESDSRFLQGSGETLPIPLVDMPYTLTGPDRTLAAIPAVGKLVVWACAGVNTGYRYTNESSATQNYVLMTLADAINTSAPESGKLAPGEDFESEYNTSSEVMMLSVAGGDTVTEFTVTQSREGPDCLFWGNVYSSG
jgi:hypothetical protein